jgi:hypothetical protein
VKNGMSGKILSALREPNNRLMKQIKAVTDNPRKLKCARDVKHLCVWYRPPSDIRRSSNAREQSESQERKRLLV